MRLLFGIFWILLLSGYHAAPVLAQKFACDGRFFISSYIDENTEGEEESYLYRINVGNNQASFVDPITYTGIKLNGVGYNQQDNLLYGINQTSIIRDDGRKLYQIVRLFADGTYEKLALGDGDINDIRWDYGVGDCSPEGYLVVHDLENQYLHYLDVSGDRVTLHQSVSLRWAPDVDVANFYVSMLDIAFDINQDGSIYTYQRNFEQVEEESPATRGALLKINGDLSSPDVGVVSVVGRPDPAVLVLAGGLFFDAAGKLYTYGLDKWPIAATEPRVLVALDKATAQATLVAEAGETRTTDGCSCPATLGFTMQATANADACQSTIDYTVKIKNNSVATVNDVVFTDTLPTMPVAELLLPTEPPLAPAADTGEGHRVVTIPAITLAPGAEISFIIRADARGQSGTLGHQAYLTNLPASLGSILTSDDTTTAEPYDPTVVTVIQEVPTLTLTPDTLVCAEQALALSAEVDPAWSYHWTGPEDFYSEEANPTITPPSDNDSAYYYLHQQRGACVLLDSMLVRTLPAPEVVVAGDTTITVGTSIALAPTLTEQAEYTYAWSPADGLSCTDCANPQASPLVATDYELAVSSSLGCGLQTSVRVDVVEAPPSIGLSIPNAFTPNNDGLNDVFIPVGSDQVHFQRFEVYNRWGELLFSALDFQPNDAHRGWDGTYRGSAVTTGTYTYRLVAIIEEKGRREYQGQVQLLR